MSMMPSTLWILFVLLTGSIVCQDVGFDLDGAIDTATATDSSFNTVGTISVHGWTVVVPQNLHVGFPAAWVPWKEFVAGWRGGSFPGYEVLVRRTVCSISTRLILDLSRFCRSKVTIRINDPNGVYSVGDTQPPFLTADDQYPSISSFSGFAMMCVPRSASDPLCPASNRPTIPGTGAQQETLTAPDPLVMAPFVAGDFVQYSGSKKCTW